MVMNHQKKKKRTQKNNKLKEDDKKTLANFKQVFGFNDDVLKKINTAHKYAKIYDDQTQCAKRKNTIRKKKMDGGSGQVKLLELAVTIAVPAFFPLGIPLTIAFGIGNKIIFEAIDKLVDNVSMSDSYIATICSLVGWVFPRALVVYMGNFIYHDHQSIITNLQEIDRVHLGEQFMKMYGKIMGATDVQSKLAEDMLVSLDASKLAETTDMLVSLDASKLATPPIGSCLVTANMAEELKKFDALNLVSENALVSLDASKVSLEPSIFQKWYELASNNPKTTSGIVITAAVVSYMGYYLYTRMLSDLEENVRLDENLYMNHRRRNLILKGQQQRFDELTENTKKIQDLIMLSQMNSVHF